ncbi:cyclin-dependent kinase 19-like [Sitodiplosis mosellana]|uniref:cyclin-dependent kinase 19-like n=1 Tax=Sitodiplosis mosellana TaxID=263140 RepID=UPI002443F472|nr:cyclin-dependent kinase 19-like [Sitodiplosis mosellana]
MDYQFISEASNNRPTVLEDYEFNEHVRIGRGSYGQVYKARQKSSSNNSMTFYALKEVKLTSYSPSACREIALYRELKQRNIMDLLKVYFSYSAQKKPGNILVMGDGKERGICKIADFVMARTFHSPLKPLEEVDEVVVTSWYRAPELLFGTRHYTKAIDIFSIGCIFAELLTNLPIFASNPETVSQPIRLPYQRNQLDKVFSVLGYPSLSSWSDLKHIPKYTKMQKELMRSK